MIVVPRSAIVQLKPGDESGLRAELADKIRPEGNVQVYKDRWGSSFFNDELIVCMATGLVPVALNWGRDAQDWADSTLSRADGDGFLE